MTISPFVTFRTSAACSDWKMPWFAGRAACAGPLIVTNSSNAWKTIARTLHANALRLGVVPCPAAANSDFICSAVMRSSKICFVRVQPAAGRLIDGLRSCEIHLSSVPHCLFRICHSIFFRHLSGHHLSGHRLSDCRLSDHRRPYDQIYLSPCC